MMEPRKLPCSLFVLISQRRACHYIWPARTQRDKPSRSNWAKDSSTLSVSRPIDVVVLNCCVMLTNEALFFSNTSTILAKSVSERLNDHIDDAVLDIPQKPLQ